MKTTKCLINADKYLNGDPCYKGDIDRSYTSQFNARVTMKIVAAPEGAQHMFQTDDELINTVRKKKFGQIGALYSDLEINTNSIINEVVIPVEFDKVDEVLSTLKQEHNIKEKLTNMNFSTNEEQSLTYQEVKDRLRVYHLSNDEIRKNWLSVVKTLRARGATPQQIIEEKKKHYKEYMSPAAYSAVIEFSVTHIVNNPSLKATVVENMSREQYEMFAYTENEVRKTAVFKAPIVSIPLLTVEHLRKLEKLYPSFKTGNNGNRMLDSLHYDVVYHEGYETRDGAEVDFNILREADKKTSLSESKTRFVKS